MYRFGEHLSVTKAFSVPISMCVWVEMNQKIGQVLVVFANELFRTTASLKKNLYLLTYKYAFILWGRTFIPINDDLFNFIFIIRCHSGHSSGCSRKSLYLSVVWFNRRTA